MKLVNADRVTFYVVDVKDGTTLTVQASMGRQSSVARHSRLHALKIPMDSTSIVGDVALVRQLEYTGVCVDSVSAVGWERCSSRARTCRSCHCTFPLCFF